MARIRNPDITVPALVRAARDEFARVGFAAARTETIVELAGTTRGALYHHFRDKAALFEAVFVELLDEINAEIARAAARKATPLAALRAGIATYLACCTRPDVRTIVLVDGPSVLGRERWHELDERTAFDTTRRAVEAAIAGGELIDTPAEPLTRIVLGMVTQSGLDIGRSPRPVARQRELRRSIDLVLDRLSVE